MALVYLVFVVFLASFARFVAPSVASELNRMIDNLPETNLQLLDAKNRLIERHPTLRQPLGGLLASALDEETVQDVALELADERRGCRSRKRRSRARSSRMSPRTARWPSISRAVTSSTSVPSPKDYSSSARVRSGRHQHVV